MKTVLNRKRPENHLQMARALEGRALQAADGGIGSLETFCFDALSWVIRYLIVNTGDWLGGRRVLVPPLAIDDTSVHEPIINVELTRRQIAGSPPLDAGRPILRAYEVRYYTYYNWPPYWEVDPLAGLLLSQVPVSPELVTGESTSSRYRESHLHRSTELYGCEAVARDGVTGKVRGLVIDLRYWSLRYLMIATHDNMSARNVLLDTAWINHVNWKDRRVNVDLQRAAVVSAPDFNPAGGISREYESQLLEHYGPPVVG
jgi:hypothetical protein